MREQSFLYWADEAQLQRVLKARAECLEGVTVTRPEILAPTIERVADVGPEMAMLAAMAWLDIDGKPNRP